MGRARSTSHCWSADSPSSPADIPAPFAPGELFYYTANDVRAGVTDVTLRLAPPGDALRRIASLVAETNPVAGVSGAALTTALALSDTKVVHEGGRVSISGLTGDHRTEITLVFAESPARLIEEIWYDKASRVGLNLPPPYLIFDREILASENLATY